MKAKLEHINSRYLLTTRRFASMAAGIALLSVLLIIFVVVPQAQSAYERFQETQDVNEDIALLEQKLVGLQNLPQSDLLQSGDQINKALPSKKPLIELLVAYSDLARDTQVQFSDISLTPGSIATVAADTSSGNSNRAPTRRGNEEYDELNLSITVAGTLNDITQFLRRVEEVTPITTVVNVSLSEDNTSQEDDENLGQSLFQADLMTTTYFFTQPVSVSLRSTVPRLSTEQQQVIETINSYYSPEVRQQDTIQGGGLEDLFGLSTLNELQAQ